jgi:hypothetical protein
MAFLEGRQIVVVCRSLGVVDDYDARSGRRRHSLPRERRRSDSDEGTGGPLVRRD